MVFQDLVGKSFALILILGSFSCASSRMAGWQAPDKSSQLTLSEETRLVAEGKRFWLTRHVKGDLEQAISRFESVARGNPEHYESMVLLARGKFLLADNYDLDSSERKSLYGEGAKWGERALATNKKFRKMVAEDGAEIDEALYTLERPQVDALYWTAVNLGQWAKYSNMATSLKYRTRIRKMIRQLAQLDPEYYYGAVHRFLGVYYAVTPYFAGGSLDKSLVNFKRSFKVNNNFLGSHVLFAQNYAVRKGDRELFEKHLNYVIHAKASQLPDVLSEQILAKKEAHALLEKIDQIFGQ